MNRTLFAETRKKRQKGRIRCFGIMKDKEMN